MEAIYNRGKPGPCLCQQPCYTVGQIQRAFWQIFGQACLYTCHGGLGSAVWDRTQGSCQHYCSWCSKDEGVWSWCTNIGTWGPSLHPEARNCRLEARPCLCSPRCGACSARIFTALQTHCHLGHHGYARTKLTLKLACYVCTASKWHSCHVLTASRRVSNPLPAVCFSSGMQSFHYGHCLTAGHDMSTIYIL